MKRIMIVDQDDFRTDGHGAVRLALANLKQGILEHEPDFDIVAHVEGDQLTPLKNRWGAVGPVEIADVLRGDTSANGSFLFRQLPTHDQ